MLTHPVLDKLRQLHCHGMLEALQEQLRHTDMQSLGFEDRLVHNAHKIELKGESVRKKKSKFNEKDILNLEKEGETSATKKQS